MHVTISIERKKCVIADTYCAISSVAFTISAANNVSTDVTIAVDKFPNLATVANDIV